MPAITLNDTGLIFRNPKSHVRSVHAYFPSLAALDNGDLVCSGVLGEAFEAHNCRTHVFRSTDRGETWVHEGPIYPGPPHPLMSDFSRITALGGGKVVAMMVRQDRRELPDEGLANPETMGFAPGEVLMLRSDDYGKTWSEPVRQTPPLAGPEFELCAPIQVLPDGRWVWSTSTWFDWSGNCPNGLRLVGWVSEDEGKTWSSYMDVIHEAGNRTFFWESKIIPLSDGRLLANAWVYDDVAKADRPNQYALSSDGGRTWTAPMSTGLQGQTMTPIALEDGRVLSVYRRTDEPGLWANLSRFDGDAWINEAERPIWGQRARGLTAHSENMADNFAVLRFGAPCLVKRAGGTVFGAFWCYEDCVSVLRWFELSVA